MTIVDKELMVNKTTWKVKSQSIGKNINITDCLWLHLIITLGIIIIIIIIIIIVVIIIYFSQHRQMLNRCLARKLVIINNQKFLV